MSGMVMSEGRLTHERPLRACPSSVAFVITGLGIGGAESQVVALALALRSRGWGVDVISMLDPVSHGESLSAGGVSLHSLGMRRGVPDPRAAVRLVRLIRRISPDVVHSHMVHANLLSRLCRPLMHVPVMISTAHNVKEGGRGTEWAYRLTDRLTDLTTNVSDAAVHRYVQVRAAPQDRIVYLPNGIDLDRFRMDPERRDSRRRELGVADRFVWLAVGRFELQKDYPTLLRAFGALRGEQAAQAQLLIAGDGPHRAEVEELCESLGLRHRVRFLGARSDVGALMNAADAFVLSSRWEGLPIVLLEAAASSLPIVATDVGGNHEIVESGRNGFLVPPERGDELAAAMQRVVDMSGAARRSAGEQGRQIVQQKFALAAVVDRWISLYSSVYAKRRLSGVGRPR